MAAESQRLAARVLVAHQRCAGCRWGLHRLHRVRTGPTGRQPDTDGDRQAVHRACRSWERGHRLPSCPDDVSGDAACTRAPVRSPDRDGAIDDAAWLTRRSRTNTHAPSGEGEGSAPVAEIPVGRRPESRVLVSSVLLQVATLVRARPLARSRQRLVHEEAGPKRCQKRWTLRCLLFRQGPPGRHGKTL